MREEHSAPKHLWTFVVDYDGGTYISQFRSSSIREAIEQYNRSDPSGRGIVPIDNEVDQGHVAISGTEGVWYTSGLINDKLAGATIIVTGSYD